MRPPVFACSNQRISCSEGGWGSTGAARNFRHSGSSSGIAGWSLRAAVITMCVSGAREASNCPNRCRFVSLPKRAISAVRHPKPSGPFVLAWASAEALQPAPLRAPMRSRSRKTECRSHFRPMNNLRPDQPLQQAHLREARAVTARCPRSPMSLAHHDALVKRPIDSFAIRTELRVFRGFHAHFLEGQTRSNRHFSGRLLHREFEMSKR